MENLNDQLWPWDGGGPPGNQGSGDVYPYYPFFSPDDIVTAADTLDFRRLATYDTLSNRFCEAAT